MHLVNSFLTLGLGLGVNQLPIALSLRTAHITKAMANTKDMFMKNENIAWYTTYQRTKMNRKTNTVRKCIIGHLQCVLLFWWLL